MKGWLFAGLAVLLAAGCLFEPDLSHLPACDPRGACPEGSTCLLPEGRCLPDCGERASCPETQLPDGTDAGGDGGAPDGGDGPDAGTPLALREEGLAVGLEGTAYLHRFQAHGGAPPYTFRATGPLPSGLTLDSEGLLSGQPAVAGTGLLDLEVVDQGRPQARRSARFALRVRPLLRLAGPVLLAEAPQGDPYEERLSATGGTPPYRFALAPGSTLPTGIVMSGDGRLTGYSEQTGAVSFTVRVTDSDTFPQEATRTLSLTTISQQLLVRLTSLAVPDGRTGTAYSHALRHAGATGTLRWKVDEGTLPPGLQLDAKTGLLSGTPTQAGTSTFTLSVSDWVTSHARTLSLQVY